MSKTILHFSINSYFASVEQQKEPELQGKPVVVCEPRKSTSGVVVSASAEAIKARVREGMSTRHALRTCPDAAIVKADYPAYEEAFDRFLDVLYNFSPQLEPESLGNASLDITASTGLFGGIPNTARLIDAEVRDKLGFTLSTGCAANKLTAEVASGLKRRFTRVKPGDEKTFLAPLPIEVLSSIDTKMRKRLSGLGVVSIGQLAGIDEERLIRQFGPVGSLISRHANGIDFRPVTAGYPRDTITIEHPCDFVIEEPDDLEVYINEFMLDSIIKQLANKNRLAGVIRLMLLDDVTERWSEAELRFKHPTSSRYSISRTLRKQIDEAMHPRMLVSRIKIVLSELSTGESCQLNLVDPGVTGGRLTGIIETLKDRFGEECVYFASTLTQEGRAGVLSRVAV